MIAWVEIVDGRILPVVSYLNESTYTWNKYSRILSGNQWRIWQHNNNIGSSKTAPAAI